MTDADDPPADDTPRLARSAAQRHRSAVTTLYGRVVRAGDGACLHLVSEGVAYELVGATAGLVLGHRAGVTGRVDRTVPSQCGRGIPFVVRHIEAQPPGGG